MGVAVISCTTSRRERAMIAAFICSNDTPIARRGKIRRMTIETFPARRTELGSLKILRALPRRGRRLVGPWCFLDRFGPVDFGPDKAMDVAPHPHIGLQTVSWLL